MPPKKSPEKSPGFFVPEGLQGPGRGPKKGAPNAGRPKNAWREFCREVLCDPETQQAIRKSAKNPKSKGFAPLLRMLASYAEGLPSQTITHEGGVTLTHQERVERLETLLANRIGQN